MHIHVTFVCEILESTWTIEILITCNGEYTEEIFWAKGRVCLDLSGIPVAFSLLLAFFGHLEGSAIEKVRGISLTLYNIMGKQMTQ